MLWKAHSAILPLLKAIKLQCYVLFLNTSGFGIALTTVPFKAQFNLHTTLKKSCFNPYIRTTITPDLYAMTRTVQMHNVKKCHSNVLHSSSKDLKMLRNIEDLSFSISIQEMFYPFLLLLLLQYRELLNSSTSRYKGHIFWISVLVCVRVPSSLFSLGQG